MVHNIFKMISHFFIYFSVYSISPWYCTIQICIVPLAFLSGVCIWSGFIRIRVLCFFCECLCFQIVNNVLISKNLSYFFSSLSFSAVYHLGTIILKYALFGYRSLPWVYIWSGLIRIRVLCYFC